MLAKENKSILLTNERTLFNLGKALLKDQETWRVGEAIERIRELKIISDEDIQDGLGRLEEFQELLSSECATKVIQLGFKY